MFKNKTIASIGVLASTAAGLVFSLFFAAPAVFAYAPEPTLTLTSTGGVLTGHIHAGASCAPDGGYRWYMWRDYGTPEQTQLFIGENGAIDIDFPVDESSNVSLDQIVSSGTHNYRVGCTFHGGTVGITDDATGTNPADDAGISFDPACNCSATTPVGGGSGSALIPGGSGGDIITTTAAQLGQDMTPLLVVLGAMLAIGIVIKLLRGYTNGGISHGTGFTFAGSDPGGTTKWRKFQRDNEAVIAEADNEIARSKRIRRSI